MRLQRRDDLLVTVSSGRGGLVTAGAADVTGAAGGSTTWSHSEPADASSVLPLSWNSRSKWDLRIAVCVESRTTTCSVTRNAFGSKSGVAVIRY